MPAPLSRVGKALLKFFKPIRVTPPHYPGRKYEANSGFGQALPSPGSNFRVIKFKDQSQTTAKTTPQEETSPTDMPVNAPTHWLDLVVYLLGACKRASDKMRRRSGVETYHRALMNKGKSKLKPVGNIIDTEETAQKDSA